MTNAKDIKAILGVYEPLYNRTLTAMKPIQRDGSDELAELAVLVDNAAYFLFQRLHDLHDELAEAPAPVRKGVTK